jgi:hypothetical protein
MRILATPEARSFIRERGGLLFVRPRRHGLIRGGLWTLSASTDIPEGALDYQRFESKDLLVFLPPGLRPPFELIVEVRGRVRRRLEAFWNGCAFVM